MSLSNLPQALYMCRSKILPTLLTFFVAVLSIISGAQAQPSPTPKARPKAADPSPTTQPTTTTTPTPSPPLAAIRILIQGCTSNPLRINLPSFPSAAEINELLGKYHAWRKDQCNMALFREFQNGWDKLFKEYWRESFRLAVFLREQQQYCLTLLDQVSRKCDEAADFPEKQLCLQGLQNLRKSWQDYDPLGIFIPGLSEGLKNEVYEDLLAMANEEIEEGWSSCPIVPPLPDSRR